MRSLKIVSIFVLLAMILAACAPAATATQPPAVEPTKPPEPTAAPVEPTKPPEPTAAPVEPTKAPAEEQLPEGVANILTIKLREGLKWSDGSPLTAKDIVGTYNIYWLQQNSVWALLKDVVAKDDLTVDFLIANPSPRALRLILRGYQPAPSSVYAKWMDEAGKMRADGEKNDSDAAKALLDDLYAFNPTETVAYGPFNIDAANITEAQMDLLKNPTGYNADKIDFDKVLLYYGETAVSLPLVLAGEVDYSTHGYTPSDVEAIKAIPNLRVFTGPTGTGPGLWFNEKVEPFEKKEVRQAFAYIIERTENATVAMGEAGKAIQYEAGFTDLQVETWLSADDIAKLNPYAKDWAKAEELLTTAGFTKGSDGKWLDPKGQPFKPELAVPADFADWLGSAENASQQLNAFGIQSVVRGYPSSERSTIQAEGKYQILVDLSIYYNPPHPFTSFNYYLNVPRNNPDSTDGKLGFAFPWKQTVDGKEVNIPDLLTEASAGFDVEGQKPAIATLAKLVNEELPVLGLFERYSTDVFNMDTRVEGWRPFEDPVYKNNQADLYMAIQMLEGELKPTAANTDKSFHTVYPYPQPPKFSLNLFPSNSLPNGVGNPSYNLMYPPLFYYIWATAEYIPAVAESYTLR